MRYKYRINPLNSCRGRNTERTDAVYLSVVNHLQEKAYPRSSISTYGEG